MTETQARHAAPATCDCYRDCRDCSLSGEWHVHPGEPCQVHPDAAGDYDVLFYVGKHRSAR